MPKHNLTGTYHHTINLIASGESWLIGKNAVIAAIETAGISGDALFRGNKITVQGTVSGEDAAMVLSAERTQLNIAQSGAAYGAIVLGGEGSRVSNSGKIISNDYGIIAEGGDIAVSNDGKIVADVCILVDEVKGTFTNGKHGFISAASVAFSIGVDDTDQSRIVNRGHIGSDDVAIRANSARDTIINTGRIVGDVVLGAGNDLFDTRGGTFKGIVVGEDGNDTLITTSAKIHLVEEPTQGMDSVRSTVGYTLSENVERLTLLGSQGINGSGNTGDNNLKGNTGDNTLIGKGGSDLLDGGKGKDFLRGGGGADTFGFATGYGKDTIADFSNADLIDISNWRAIDNFRQLKVHAENHGDDVWIVAGHDTLVIDNSHKADLHAGDFHF